VSRNEPGGGQDGNAADPFADPVAFVVGLIGGVEPGLDRAVAEEAVVRPELL